MSKSITILIFILCATGLYGQTEADDIRSKITHEIAGNWRLVTEKNSKAKKSEFKMDINTVEPTETKNIYKMTGSIVGFAIEDGYAYYKGNVLVFGYTRTNIVGINPIKEEYEYITGSIQDGKLTFISYSPKSSSRILSATIWERPE